MEDSGIDSDPKQNHPQEDEKLFPGSDSSCSSTSAATPQRTNTKQLHKKLGSVPTFEWKESRKPFGKTTLSTPDRDSNLDILITDSLIYCVTSALDKMATEAEQRIEQAKKSQRIQDYKKNPSLIPIQRLPIPGKLNSSREQQPLVDWESDESDDDINFFPLSRIKDGKQELTDTFSIEDFEVSPDEDDLNLLPPKPMYHRWMCCIVPANWKCVIM
uniref:Uncharacterized protein n=1 Tax=Timema shepardi TaxID=629360 RepID=A0A7R9AY95_TIMSH|nr:unnamed protein product [Timema shepardi]